MNYAILAKLGIAAALTVGLATPATALAAEQPTSHSVTATITANTAGDITVR